MAIFPSVEVEGVVQVDDLTRISAVKSLATQDEAAITLVEIEPDTAVGFIDVTGTLAEERTLDWAYATDGDKTVTVRVTTDGAPVSKTATISVITAADDLLLSSDTDLIGHEGDILSWIRDGRNSFIDKHRTARDLILAYLDQQKIWRTDGTRLTAVNLTDVQEFKEWAKFETLVLIFEGLSNAIDDIFAEKARRYSVLRGQARNRAALRLDRDTDGNTDLGHLDVRSGFLYRR